MSQKLKIWGEKARAGNKRRIVFLAKIAITRWIYFIHIFRQLLVPKNLSKAMAMLYQLLNRFR